MIGKIAANSAYGVTVSLALLAATSSTHGASHLWRFNEVFSNADGTVQFIELRECCGADNEIVLLDKWVRSATTGMQYTFPANLPCSDCTANAHLLLATQGFADLPGAPTPDHIIPDGFFDVAADELTYWLYPDAFMNWTGGAVPTNGIDALLGDGTTSMNSPTNFADETGNVVASCDPADLDASGDVGFTDLVALLAAWGPCGLCPQDLDRNGEVAFTDLTMLLGRWGPC